MADVTVKYNGSAIAQLSGTGSKTLKTSGKYCEGDIEVNYSPNSKTYEITLTKASGWILLATLDDDVLAHINDTSLVVSLVKICDTALEKYCGTGGFATNTPIGYSGTYGAYGSAILVSSDTTFQVQPCYYPANNTGTSTSLGGRLIFRLSGTQYYVNIISYYINKGTYRLTFTW